jgi:hypothetical protein
MKRKLLLVLVVVIFLVGAGLFFITYQNQTEQKVLESTYNISKEYLLLRYRTDDILVKAKNYSDYSTWKGDMAKLLKDWQNLEEKSQKLENSAVKVSEVVAINFNLVQTAHAYSAKEISNIYDKAPRFKGIATLASHLGVDAKRAQVILDKAQAEISADVFTEEGDAFETLENTATVVKDGCKVVGFVGGVVLTGGVAGLATAGTLTQVGVVVVGADLALEVTEDGAQIAFGDRNKVSSFVKDVRTVTEPIATVITISNVPSNLGNAFGKFDSVMVGLEQFRESAQEGKVIGVDLRNFEYEKPFQRIRQAKYPGTVSAAEMEMAEVETWLQSLNKKYEPTTQQEVENFLSYSAKENENEEIVEEKKVTEKENDSSKTEAETISPVVEQTQETTKDPVTSKSMAGTYSGSAALQHVEEDVETPDSLPVTLQLNENGTGTVNVNGYGGEAHYAGSSVGFSVNVKEGGAVVNCVFEGNARSNGSQTVISGNMHVSMMGVTFASYAWSAQK